VLFIADKYQMTMPVPFVPGSEFAGVITEAGPAVAGFAVGDRVFGSAAVGAFAEEITLATTSLTRIPEGVGDAAAAAFGVAHRTAYHVLRSVAEVRPGERVVVLGAGGGVGLAAVQGAVPKIPLNLVLLKGCRILGFEMRTFPGHEPDKNARDERALRDLMAAGKAFPHVGATFGFADTVAALRHVADGRAIGKVVLEIA
jgi:NADPH:quinone reductase-like Zn-dependent oxidoreductase